MKKQYIKPEIAEYRFSVRSQILAGSKGEIDETPASGPACGREYNFFDED